MMRWITVSIDAAEVAGDAAQHDAQHQAERHADQADRQRDPACAYISRDHRSRPCTSVPSRNIVSAGSALLDADQVAVVGIRPRKLYSKPAAKNRIGIFWPGRARRRA